MQGLPMLHRSLVTVLAFCGQLGVAMAQPVSDKVLSRVRVTETEACAIVSIDFNVTVQVKSSFPETEGDHVRIDLNPIEIGRINGAIRSREELRPPASKRAGIQEIQYDGDAPTGPVLTLTFSTHRYFQIDQGSDFRSVTLQIADAPIGEACSSARPALRTGPEDGVAKKAAAIESSLRSTPAALDANAVYAINLLSQREPVAASANVDAAPMKPFAAYVVRFEEDGVVWNRLRLGFFKTRTEAQRVLSELAVHYPEAWIVRTSETERQSVLRAWLAARSAPPRARASAPSEPKAELADNADAAGLVAEARKQMTAGEIARAIQLLSKALTLEENTASADARELLGVAREKNGQSAHAKAEYEEYLRRYPDGEGADRVRQRLSALLTAGKDAPPALREGPQPGNWVKRLTASLSQFYQRDESVVTIEQPNFVPDPDKQVNRNALLSSADVTASIGNDRVDTTLRFSGGHTKDFETGGNSFGSISAFFLEVVDSVSRFAARVGRQTRSTGGVLGRFDGGLVSFEASDKVKLNVVAGAPVIRSRDLFVDDQRRFVGGSIEVSQIVKGLDTTTYFIHQTVDDLVDRQAAGFEFRYVDDTRSAYGLIDYDVFYDTLNLALFNGTWRLKDNTTFNTSFDYRLSPSLMTIDALQGQGVDTIDQLRAAFGFTDNDIYFLAESRAARSKSGSFTVTHPFSDKLQLNLGATLTSVGPTIDAGGVLGQPATGVEKFYSAQLLATSLVKEGDLATIGFRYDDLSTARRYVVDVNTRYPVSSRLRINPRLRLAKRDSTAADQVEFTVKPSIRFNYIPSRRFQLELEGGGEWSRTTRLLDTETTKGYYMIAGYRIDF